MFTSTWGQNNTQPQQGAFGQSSVFGNAGASAFGQPQQPAANPMFGNLNTTTPANTGTGGFGAFGGNTGATTSTSIFGQPKPATGFGAFGGGTTSTFGNTGGSVFGQQQGTTTGTTTAFGTPATTGAFGTTTNTSIFGAKPATTSAFGTTQQQQMDGVAPVSTGSSNPPYATYNDKDGTVTLQYQAISCMPAYRGTSFEELRYQDYMQGRKTAGQFGQSAAFGGATTTPGSIFGNTAAAPATSIFGQTQPAAATTGFGAFGQTQPAAPAASTSIFGGGGAFGQQQQQQPATTGFGTFGQAVPAAQTQPATSIFGGAATGTNAFGTKPATTGFGAFGQTQPAAGTTGTNAFGAFGQQQQPTATGTGLFGQTQPAAGTSTFGTGGGLFGQNNNAAKPSIFGTAATGTTGTTPFGAFGQQPQQQQTGTGLFGGGGGLFGQNNQQQQQQGGGLFGQAQPAQTSMFGTQQPQQQQSTTTGIFGNTNNNQQTGTGAFGSIFGKPATTTTQPVGGGLFGGGFGTQQNQGSTLGQNTQQTGSIFGNTGNNQLQTGQQQQGGLFGGGLFGAKPNAPTVGSTNSLGGSSLFGGSGIFGGSTNSNNTSQTQQNLTASISQPIGTNLPIFSMLPPGPRAVTMNSSTARGGLQASHLGQDKKKAGFFVDVPTRSPVPRLQLGGYQAVGSKLRGFGSSVSGTGSPNALGSSASLFSSGKANALSFTKDEAGPSEFMGRSGSPSLGSGGRQSVKKLILDKKVDAGELFKSTGSSVGGSPGKGGLSFSPALSVSAREKEAAHAFALTSSATGARPASPSPAAKNKPMPNRFTAQGGSQATVEDDTSTTLEEGQYWVKPSLQALKQAGYDELSAFPNLVVGRVGYGEIHFLAPVDLTGLPKLTALFGDVVRFDEKECTVYPDSDDVDKPTPGQGLNVKARIILLNCWATDKSTREPVKDEKHPSAVKQLKRLKGMKDTVFENFDIAEGKWTFTVEHF